MAFVMGEDQKRSAQADYIATELLTRTALLTRLAIRQVSGRFSRTEAGVLRTLSRGPQRITDLAELEGLAQPSVTLMVRRLEDGGLVGRERDPEDGRVVLVSLTAAGAEALEDFLTQVRVVLHEYLAEMSDLQLDALASAADAIQELIDRLQQGPARPVAGALRLEGGA
ncbi:MAG TPA: MarR family transcriptional regulator [Solirubrobacteraceae bacterium]|jgi:DNA-binding MarR family transcriptional regulator|nr:MarR family transcriptional regulator [Solirubrobacteraceae bacterium]